MTEPQVTYYETIKEKVEKCAEMVGQNTMKFEYEKKKEEESK
tara:strand:+ start:237 stop:362 length:126 start_codon:yes stop_codon:yes gene_type:complete